MPFDDQVSFPIVAGQINTEVVIMFLHFEVGMTVHTRKQPTADQRVES